MENAGMKLNAVALHAVLCLRASGRIEAVVAPRGYSIPSAASELGNITQNYGGSNLEPISVREAAVSLESWLKSIVNPTSLGFSRGFFHHRQLLANSHPSSNRDLFRNSRVSRGTASRH